MTTPKNVLYAVRIKKQCYALRPGQEMLFIKKLVVAATVEVARITFASITTDGQLGDFPFKTPQTTNQILCRARFKDWVREEFPLLQFKRSWLDALNNYINTMVVATMANPQNKISIDHIIVPALQVIPSASKPEPEITLPTKFKKALVTAPELEAGGGMDRKHYIVNYTAQFGRALIICESRFFTAKTRFKIECWIRESWERCGGILGTPKLTSITINSVKTENTKELVIYEDEEAN